MQAGRQEPVVLEGLSRFLVVHESCGAGFDVAHPAGVGSGRVSITCRGCGARHEYMTSTIEVEREVSFELAPSGALAPLDPDEPMTGSGEKPQPGRLSGARAGTIALLLIALAALLVAAVRLAGGSGKDSGAPAAEQGPRQPAASAERPAGDRHEGGGRHPAPSAPKPRLRSVSTERYSLAVPAGWATGSSESPLRISGAGGTVSMRVYADTRPDLGLAEMGRLTTDLLDREHPGSKVSAAHRTTVGGARALTMTGRLGGVREVAFAIARGAQRFLILESLESQASAASRSEADAVVTSFQPG
jgi:hypothetical protein